ncbi:MAG: gluconokinase, partial [Bacteroidota bacterium]
MNYYIGIDIGTTSTKAVAFSDNGDVISKDEIAYPIIHPYASYSEQNPNEIFEAVVNSIGKISETLNKNTPLLISFSAAMHSVLAVDESGKPLTNCIIWADNRASDIAVQLREIKTGNVFYHKTGVPIHAMSPFCKLLWLKENEPGIFSAAAKFIGIKEYVFFRLFGKYIVDTSVASATGFLNIHNLQWDAAILDYSGIHESQLSSVTDTQHKEYLQPGSHYYKDMRLKHVLQSAFIIGSSDGALANLGSGAVGKNSMAVSIGTSCAVRMVTAEVYTDEHMRTFCYHLANSNYIIGGASNNGAVILQWFKDDVLETTATHEELFQQAGAIAAGSNGLIFIPYVLGERAPVWNSEANGVFFGLNIAHKRAHFVRAVMEGIV